MTSKDKATGFAAQFEELTSDESPLALPEIESIGQSKPTQPKKAGSAPKKKTSRSTKTSRSKTGGLQERRSVGLQLTKENIVFIGRYAEKHRLFKQVAFDQICVSALDSLDETAIISGPVRNGPDDYAYFPQKTVRVFPDVLDRIDSAAAKWGVNRSIMVRHLIDQVAAKTSL